MKDDGRLERRWEELAASARREPAPTVDVTHRVMAAIAAGGAEPTERVLPWTLLVCTLGSLAAAGVVATMAASWWSNLGDPLLDLLQSADVVLK